MSHATRNRSSRRESQDFARANDQNSRILAKLREAGPRGVTNAEMWQLGAHAAHSRISDLRKRGHKVTCEREAPGIWRYRLITPPEQPKTNAATGGWIDGPRVTGLPLFDSAVRP